MTVYFAHITDTHLRDGVDDTLYGRRPYTCTAQLVDILNTLPQKPDFVVHTGDVVDMPSAAAYSHARELFGRLTMPVYFAAGNHDNVAMMRDYLPFAPYHSFSDASDERLVYAFEVGDERFLVLDARGVGYRPLPQGWLPEAQLALLKKEMAADTRPLTIFIHYPILSVNSRPTDTHMLVMNGEAVHQALLPGRERIRAVFHGHIHRPFQTVRDGILYTAASSAIAQLDVWPADTTISSASAEPVGFSFVHCLPQHTLIQPHTF